MPQRDTRWITIALAFSTASTGPQMVALSLLMPEISTALNASTATLGQLNTAFSSVALIGSLIMGLITVRYSPKKLLLAGIICLLIGVAGASLSRNYREMLIFFILYGVGNSLVLPVVSILITLYPQQERTTALGRIYSGRSLTSIIATPIIGFLAALYGWRTGYIGFGAPLIILAFIFIASKVPEQSLDKGSSDLTQGFREIMGSTSAQACIIGAALSLAFFNGLIVFNGAYMRGHLYFSLEKASLVMSILFIAIALGQIASGTLTTRIGIKTTTWLSALTCGVSLLFYFTLELQAIILILVSIIGAGMAGVTMTTMATLALEQLPENRGTMMSMNSAAMSVGAMLSTIIGGVAINSYGFSGYAVLMFALSLLATKIFYLWTREA